MIKLGPKKEFLNLILTTVGINGFGTSNYLPFFLTLPTIVQLDVLLAQYSMGESR